jgi:hypothetical protein
MRVVETNLLGTFLTGRTAARAMVASGTGGGIVNMSSVNATLVIPGMAGYVSSKGGVWPEPAVPGFIIVFGLHISFASMKTDLCAPT